MVSLYLLWHVSHVWCWNPPFLKALDYWIWFTEISHSLKIVRFLFPNWTTKVLIAMHNFLGDLKLFFICFKCVIFISSPDPKGHVSYCHHLAFVVVIRRKLFQKSSPLKVLDQWKPNLVWIITRVSSFKIVSGDAVHQPTWLLLLKIEHMVKLQVLGNNSKTVNNIKNLTWGKNDQHITIYLPCNFEVNLITYLGVIALFSSNL